MSFSWIIDDGVKFPTLYYINEHLFEGKHTVDDNFKADRG